MSATNVYFGTTVVDPYRNLEDAKDALAAQWIAGEAARTRATLDALAIRPRVAAAVAAASPAPALSDLTLSGDRVFYSRRIDARTNAIFVRPRGGGAARAVIASSALGAADAPASIGAFAVSPDGTLLALHVTAANPSNDAIAVVRVGDGTRVEPPLENVVFDAVGWLPDSKHVVYDHAGAPGPGAPFARARAVVHALGTPQARDRAVLGSGVAPGVTVGPDDFAFVDAPLGSPFAIAEVRDSANRGSRFYAAPVAALTSPRIRWRPLGTAEDAFTDYAVHGSTIDLATATGAPNYRVVRADLRGAFAPETVLPGDAHAVVSGTLDGIPKAGIFALNAARDGDYVQLLEGGVGRVVRIPWTAGAAPLSVALPLQGTVLAIATDQRRDGALFDLTTWTDPGDAYRYAPGGTATATGWRALPVAPGAARVAEERDAVAADGTRIPVSIVRRADAPLDGSRPVLLQTIGAYGFSTTPAYNAVPEAWLALGGIFAVAHVRGGGEFGEAWRAAGRGANKANTWNDLVACGEHARREPLCEPAPPRSLRSDRELPRRRGRERRDRPRDRRTPRPLQGRRRRRAGVRPVARGDHRHRPRERRRVRLERRPRPDSTRSTR